MDFKIWDHKSINMKLELKKYSIYINVFTYRKIIIIGKLILLKNNYFLYCNVIFFNNLVISNF